MKIVLGLGFGDEGKGLTTSFLCSQQKNPIVIRFNGGHQAGHQVVHGGKRHIFSSFGAGTLQGAPTYWSKYCTFFPTAVLNEFEILKSKNITPTLYVHPLCPVTTPYDLYHNRSEEKKKKHGSVGVGFGATLQRQENFYKLYVQDLFYPKVLEAKLNNIVKYYGEEDIGHDDFLQDIEEVKKLIVVRDESILDEYEIVFEGAQGILLDQDFGFFPNVTRSNTTSKNALEIIKNTWWKGNKVEIFYVTRSYQTRHGNGFMSDECELNLINNEKETNVSHEFQGNFRVGKLDPELLNYALECDSNFHKGSNISKNLVITCTDQYQIDVPDLLRKLKNTAFDKVYISDGDNLTNIKLLFEK